MKPSSILSLAMLLMIAPVALWAAPAPATRPATDPFATTKPAASADQSDVLTFEDSSRSATTRLGGGARGIDTGPNVFLLVSAKPGKTINPRPTIFWYITDATEADVDLVISEPGKPAPTYRQRHTGKLERGLHTFSLAEAPGDLQVGVQYKVTVTVWEDAEDPSVNPFSTGFIERIAPPPGLAAGEKGASPADYGRAGLWYDVLDSLSQRIEKEPANTHLRNQRLGLLRQQEIFLTFSPGKQYAAVSGIAEAEAFAKKREQQLLSELAADDQRELKLAQPK